MLPERPVRQCVLARPYSIRGLVAVRGDVLNAMAKSFIEEVFRWQRARVDAKAKLHGAAVVVPQLFGGSATDRTVPPSNSSRTGVAASAPRPGPQSALIDASAT